MIDKFSDKPLLAASWIGSSIGSLDLGLAAAADRGLFLSSTITGLPSEQLLGSGIGDILIVGYVLAGAAAIGNDIMEAK